MSNIIVGYLYIYCGRVDWVCPIHGISLAHGSVWDEQAPCQEKTIWAHYRGNSRNQSSQGNITQPRSNRMLSQGHPLSSIFPEKHVEENAELNVTVNSALMSSSYLISATLNTEWLAWIVYTPQKSTFMIKEW